MATLMGERIRALRAERGYTLEQLAKEAGASKSYVWELENKAPPRPSAEKLSAIAAALGTTVDALIGTPINSADDLNAEDKVFFRKFRSLDPKDRERLRRMVDLWDDE